LDVVVANDLVDVLLVDVGLSDHHLLGWRVPLVRSLPIPVAVASRSWKRLDMVALQISISTSLLCQPDDVDTLAAAYDSVLTDILDTLLPVRHFIRVQDRLTPGSIKSVAMPSVIHELFNGVIRTAVVLLTLQGLLWLVPPATTLPSVTASTGIRFLAFAY